jgi:hypothetical protein
MQVGRKSFGEEAKRTAQMLEKTHRQEDVWQLQETTLTGRI